MNEKQIEEAKANGDYEDKIYELNEVKEDGRSNWREVCKSCD